MSKVFLNLLNNTGKKILSGLEPFFKQDGILSGGTSLMLQVPYRKSYDFDLFFPFNIPANFAREAADAFNSNIEILLDNHDELTFIANKKIRISFIFFPFKRKYKPVIAENFIKLSSYKDIASDKAYAIGRRPEYRDYVDLFIILKNGFSLKKIISDAREKFSGEFSEKLFLSQLVYFEDLKDFTADFINDKPEVNEIQSFFNNIVKNHKLL